MEMEMVVVMMPVRDSGDSAGRSQPITATDRVPGRSATRATWRGLQLLNALQSPEAPGSPWSLGAVVTSPRFAVEPHSPSLG